MQYDFSDHNPVLGKLYPRHVEDLCKRHDRALEQSGAAHAVIFSGSPKYAFLDDNTYPFRANPHFLCWAPLPRLPFSYVIYTPGKTPVLVYHQPRDYWHPVPDAPGGYWTQHFDVRVVNEVEQTARHFPEDRDKCILIGEIDDARYTFGVERINPTAAINILHFARGSKTEYELACMRLSARRGAIGHVAAAAAFRDGQSEFAIHQAYCKATLHTDNELPYDNIIALNEHGSVLHYTDLDRQAPAESRSFLIDAGAQVHGYAADITRTYSSSSAAFSALIARMEALQLDVISRVRAGIDYRQLHLDTHELLAGVLLEAGIASGDSDALISTGVTSAFMPHGLGHLLGLQVHDVGGFMQSENGGHIEPPASHTFLRLTRVLETNMVLTIEPGLYAIDMLLDELRDSPANSHVCWKAVDELRGFGGVRVEDNIRVLNDGCENLTRDAFDDIQ